jgi:Ca2+-binding EF-hand superfamily protein
MTYHELSSGWRWRSAAILAVGASLLCSGGPVLGQPAAGISAYDEEQFAFDAADSDRDGVINEAEMTRDAAVGFAALDKDGSGTLAVGELAPHDPAQFRKVDADGDGLLTFREVMTNKVRALNEGDRNQDGGLSFDEMVEIVETETGGAS